MSLRVALYVRVSTQDQSCDLQRRELEAFAAARDWKIVHIYEDRATGTNTKRPMLNSLMADARVRRFDLVAVWKLDRYARSLKDLVLMLQELSELGVQFVSLKDQLDLTTSGGRLMMHMLGAFAEFEASIIRERVRAGIQNKIRRTGRWGRGKSRDDEKIELLKAKGLSNRAVARELGLSEGTVRRSIASASITLPKQSR